MRIAASLSAILIAAAATAAQAAPIGPVSEISISIGPELQDKADTYGEREFGYLARDLRRSVESSLARAGALTEAGGGRLELTIVGATPNRPTLEQLGDKPGLSTRSFGIGGAEVDGVYIAPDGASTPLHYRWYEGDIRWARHASTWSDAEQAFDRFAMRLTRGPALAGR